jgi:hypothetical protein
VLSTTMGYNASGRTSSATDTRARHTTMGTEPAVPDWQQKTGCRAQTGNKAEYWCLLLMLALWLLVGCSPQSAATPDRVATGVAIERAIRATLTAEAPAPTDAPTPGTSPSPNAVATGVAVQRAVAATLTAEKKDLPTVTRSAVPTIGVPDVISTGVALQRAIAATLTSEAPIATATLVPSAPVATATPSINVTPEQPAPTPSRTMPDCVSWLEAQDHVGAHQCICGVVTETYDDPNSTAFFINFGSDRTGYYAVSFNLTFAGLEGRCVRICGVVEMYRERPQTIIRAIGQVEELGTCP